MTVNEQLCLKNPDKVQSLLPRYEVAPPDGGWGYFIAGGFVAAITATIVPLQGFGIIYGPFLERIGDATSSIALVCSVSYTITSFTGLPVNLLLQKLSFRKVGFLGFLLFSTGAFINIFATGFYHLMIGNGILQGLGMGLIMPASFSSLNSYFLNKRYVVMSVAQTLLGLVSIFVPAVLQVLMNAYGYRGTVAILAAFSLNALPAMALLQPVKWHNKIRKSCHVETENGTKRSKVEDMPLLLENQNQKTILGVSKVCDTTESSIDTSDNNQSRCLETFSSCWNSLVKAFDLGLFTDPVYVNISVGVSLGVITDLSFIQILPSLLSGIGFTATQTTFILTTYFVTDLIGRIALSVICAILTVRGRYLYLLGASVTVILRIAFTIGTSFWWIASVSAILGLFRGLIHIPSVPIFQEAYAQRFVTAYSLNMVIAGCLSLSCGFLVATIKDYTKSDIFVVYFQAIIFLLCVVPWSIELLYSKSINNRNVSKK